MTKYYHDGKPVRPSSCMGKWRVTIAGTSNYCICWAHDEKSYRLVEYVPGDENLSADALKELCEVRYAIRLIAGDVFLDLGDNRPALHIRWPAC